MLHMDVPVAIALTAGTAWGAWNTFSGSGEVYFESLTAVIFLLLFGRWIQFRRQYAAQDAVEQLYRLTPQSARLIETGGAVREVPVEALQRGDRVELLAGESVPADGIVAEGESEFDLSLLTGESRPVRMGQGEPLHAGTVNLSSRVVLEVESVGAQTRVGRLMAMVERFANDRPPLVQLADRAAHWFVIATLSLAALTALIWLWLDPALAVEQAGAIAAVFTRALPGYRDDFQSRLQALMGDLEALDQRLAAVAARIGDAPLIFSHPVYQYVERRHGLNAVSVHWEPDEAPDAGMWRELEELLDEHPARWMIWEGEPPPDTVRRLEAMGIRSVVYAPCGNRPEQGDFLAVMGQNLARLEDAFPR
jgi:hypothetical protein